MSETYLSNTPLRQPSGDVTGAIIERDGEPFYRIGRYDRMPPFLMSVVSGYNHWMYVSSTGGITCGRRNPSFALFPYETDDRVHDACHTAGPMTTLLVNRSGQRRLWEPFARGAGVYRTERNLYKNLAGNRLVFEELNHDLGLSFEYQWSTGVRFGFIRRAALKNREDVPARVSVLDGLRNVMPCGVDPHMQTNLSTLVDAYRQAEVHGKTGTGIFTLSSVPTDRAEPSEALKATCAWNAGLGDCRILLSTDQVTAFREGGALEPEVHRRGRRGDYLVHFEREIEGAGALSWYLLADVDQGPSDVVALLQQIEQGVSATEIEQDIAEGTHRLEQRAAGADAFQLTADTRTSARHYSNTLFNIMRGGVFHDENNVSLDDFLGFAWTWNAPVADRFEDFFTTLAPSLAREDLLLAARDTGDPALERLALEYLPLTFSRRHGDPSRPWNAFDIDISNPDGTEKLAYQGNWRDIFQNWEALAWSYPGYLENFITKFVNASTADGYNPYRITQDGIDWEILDPDDPWSYIGYWGDHQVAYLLRLLEMEQACYPGRLGQYLDRELFVYANVPYRIVGYEAMLANPRDTVEFDVQRQARIEDRVQQIGSDGRLCVQADATIARVNLLEKLLVTALVKIGNLVPGGGIWMNTQRPEWNDANNALVGFGLSMVTLCYLRRFLVRLSDLVAEHGVENYRLSEEALVFLDNVSGVLEHPDSAAATRDDGARKAFMDRMGAASEAYRESVYAGLSGRKDTLQPAQLTALIDRALALLDDSIVANRRDDGLYHAYNILKLDERGHGVEHLQEMLEGQVAVLNTGLLEPAECLSLLDSLQQSLMFRPDQQSYTLYPSTPLPGFLEKNVIDPEQVAQNAWIQAELDSGRTQFVERDVQGRVHFNGRFRNAAGLRQALQQDRSMDGDEAKALCDVFESVFQHRRFTGRSGTMYKYEGLGSIYWHMISKLLLVVGEIVEQAQEASPEVRAGLLAHYEAIKAGIGAHKSPDDYGAFPMDPYSHTPAFAGVQQPGMTGQVKEDVISRFGELGVRMSQGRVNFKPNHLRQDEFHSEAQTWHIPGGDGGRTIELPPRALAFTLCGVPVIYRLGEKSLLRLHRPGGETVDFPEPVLEREWSQALFARDGAIERIVVDIETRCLR
jgi:hypothetical protein